MYSGAPPTDSNAAAGNLDSHTSRPTPWQQAHYLHATSPPSKPPFGTLIESGQTTNNVNSFVFFHSQTQKQQTHLFTYLSTVTTTATTASVLDDTVAITRGTGIDHLVTMLGYPDGKTTKSADITRYNRVLPATRATTFDSPGFVGLGFITPTNRFNYLFLPSTCTDTNGEKYIIGTASNNALTPEIRLLGFDAFKGFLAIGPKKLFPTGSPIGDVPLDLSIPRVAELVALVDSAITDDTEHPLHLARISTTITVPGGTLGIAKGKADDQAVEDSVASFGGPPGAQWFYHAVHWSPIIQAAFLSEADLAQFLPPGGGDVTKYYSNPHINYALINLEDDDELCLADKRKRQALQSLITLDLQRKTPASREDAPPVAEIDMRSPLERAPPSGPPGGPKNSTLSGRRSRPETPSSAPAGRMSAPGTN